MTSLAEAIMVTLSS